MNHKDTVVLVTEEVRRRVRQFADNLSSERLNAKRVTFDPQKWNKRLKNFISGFGGLAADETPLLMWDITTLKGGKLGMLLTDQAVYSAHEGASGVGFDVALLRDRVVWSDIRSVVEFKNHLWINGWRFFNPWGYGDKQNILGLFTEIIRTVSEATSDAARPGAMRTIGDEDWDGIVAAERPTLLVFPHKGSGDGECRARKVGRELFLKHRYGSCFDFATVHYAESQKIVEALGLEVVPAIVLVYHGTPLAIQSGNEVNLEAATVASEGVIKTMDAQAGAVGGLAKMEENARKEATQAGRNLVFENYLSAIMSGLVVGIAVAVTRANDWGAVGFLVCAFLYGWLILKFGISAGGKIIATIIAIIVASTGPEVWEWMKDSL